jgi:hypothetical protein
VDDLPKTLSETYASLDAQYCKEAIQNEMNSILTNRTWEIYDCRASQLDVNGYLKRN